MAGTSTCRICAGPLWLLHAGANGAAGSGGFSPTNHEPGRFSDLFECERCGTVQQPALPSGERLLSLYRTMEDPAYLEEESGRRRTARRLLALVPAGGRLLDVGCGHGLLLDEARAAGFAVEGLELSRAAAGYARSALGLAVREETLDEAAGVYDAIVMVDVIEHLDDPVAALDRALALLAPGGTLVVVTPDPSSRTARLAGARWWGFLPAHTYLLPRATLRSLLTRRGFAVVR